MTRARCFALVLLVEGCASDPPGEGWDGPSTEGGTGEASPTDTSSTGSPTGVEGSTGESTAGGTSPDEGSTGEPTLPDDTPIRYPAGRVHSPVTTDVADRWKAIAERSSQPREDVFLKAGASSTVSPNTLFCFESETTTDLGAHVDLAAALAYFRGGDAAGSSPFGRVTLAAESGRSAAWAVNGDPSPLDQEWDAISPRIALVHYGTNDMNLGATFGSAMIPFHEAMTSLLDDLVARGTIPVLFGITRRGDDPAADLWVESYNAAIRGMAQAHQIPFIDLFEAIDTLPNHGLSDDGIHLLPHADGACLLTEEGLQWGYNMRNLVALEGLDRTMAVLVDDATVLDEDAPVFSGVGTAWDPFMVDAFPFAHSGDTTTASSEAIDAYPPCDDADESGPEIRYRIELDAATALRILVLDDPDVDVDIHVLEADGDGDTCIVRADRRIEGALPAGTWDIVVDTWSDGVETFAGEYLLLVLPCQPGDEACAGALL